MTDNEKSSLINLVPNSVDQAVGNLTNAPTKSIGDTLSDIWALVFGLPIHHIRQKRDIKYAQDLELYEKQIRKAVSNIPIDKRSEPDFQTVSLALENSKYCITNEYLRKMFVNLITASMNLNTANDIHPAFSEIIKQMNSIDAKVFQRIFKIYGSENIPMIFPTITLADTQKYFTKATPKWFLGLAIDDCDMFQISISLVNLNRLGLIELYYDRDISGDDTYQELEHHPDIVKALATYQSIYPNERLLISKTNCCGVVTEFGLKFAHCCLY